MGVTDNEAAGIFGVTVGVGYLLGWLADRDGHRNEAVILLMPEYTGHMLADCEPSGLVGSSFL